MSPASATVNVPPPPTSVSPDSNDAGAAQPAVEQTTPSIVPNSDLETITQSTRYQTQGGFVLDSERGARDSIGRGTPAHALAVDAAHDPFSFFHMDNDRDIHVFDEPPTVRVLGGRFEDAWPTRYVEYDVELTYKSFTWQVEIPKSSISSLWIYIKSRPHLRHAGPTTTNVSERTVTSANISLATSTAWPQLRKLFLSSAEKSVSPEMIAMVQQLLDMTVKVPRLLCSEFVVSLFQVSNSTFDDEEGCTSVREGWLKVRFWLKGNRENVRINRGAVTCDNECFNCMCVVKRVNFRAKKWRWVALKHSSIAIYSSIEAMKPTEAFLFDQKFSIERGIQSTGSNTALLVSNATYVLQLEAKNKQSILKWANGIRKIAELSDWSQAHRDGSFAVPRNPTHMHSYARWYVDGKDAYEAIFHGISSARKEIFIAGWWICPTIHLLRPAALYPQSRLDLLLKKKALEGVHIYILMYKEVSVALTLNSYFSKQVFRGLHENIHVLRDPDFLMKQLGMWSHHEKIVSIDQKVSFVGGLDLCFGRWDTGEHVLFDAPGGAPTDFVGKDYSNPRVKDFIEVDQPEIDMIDRTKVPRMPWHDCHCRLEGQPARDVARHFVQRWNYSVSTRKKSKKLHHLVPRKDYTRASKDESSSKMLAKRLQKAVHAVRAAQGIRRMTVDGDGRDGRDERAGRDGDNRGFNSNRRISKMLTQPQDSGSPMILEDQPMLQVESDDELDDEFHEDPRVVERRGYQVHTQILRSLSLWSGGVSTERSIQNAYIRLISSAHHFVYIENQFFVSGLEGDAFCSNRIANALVERIRRASENKEQFRVMVVMPLLPAFPGKPDDKDASSLRGVMHWQYRTICRGEYSIYHKLFRELDDDPFKYIAFYGLRAHSTSTGDNQPETEEVYIHSKVMIVDDRSAIIGSANVNERSMCGDRDSEIAVVVEDHEMEEHVKIANKAFAVGKFAHSFRMKLFEEHFGVEPGTPLYKKYEDPVNRDAWFTMQEQAMRNHQIYDSVFGCLPSDNVSSFKQIDPHIAGPSSDNNANSPHAATAPGGRKSATTPTTPTAPEHAVSDHGSDEEAGLEGSRSATLDEGRKSVFSGAMAMHLRGSAHISDKKEELQQVQGHIVYFPLKFLADEQLEPKLFPAELFQ